MRVVLVYGFSPSGHAGAASALAASLRGRGDEVVEVNVSADLHPILGPALAKTYLTIIRGCPALWAAVYDHKTLAGVARQWRRPYLLANGRRLRSKLREVRPDVIVCTQATPLAALALEKQRGGLSCPLVGAITDYEPHSFWPAAKADLYLAPTSEAAQKLGAAGVPAERVRVTGIPIDPIFEAPLDKGEARAGLGLPREGAVVLLSGGSRGIGPLAQTAEVLLEKLPGVRVLAACGHNDGLFESLRAKGESRLAAYRNLDVGRMKELMCAADLLIGKAGGLTVAESAALGLPMVVFEPIPGQEERNADYLLSRGAAARADSLDDLARRSGRLLSGEADAIRVRLKAIARPDSSRRAADEIRALAARRPIVTGGAICYN